VSYPHDPDQPVYSYLQGTTLRDSSLKEVSDYYRNLASWFPGGIHDQFGRRYDAPQKFKMDYWEVLNEPISSTSSRRNLTPPSTTRSLERSSR